MDYLPYPDDAILPPLKIPYLCADIEQYDGLGFIDFPLRMGWINRSRNPTRANARTQ